MSQLSFVDIELELSGKPSRIGLPQDKINTIVDWDTIYDLVNDIDYTNTDIGGRPPPSFTIKNQDVVFYNTYIICPTLS